MAHVAPSREGQSLDAGAWRGWKEREDDCIGGPFIKERRGASSRCLGLLPHPAFLYQGGALAGAGERGKGTDVDELAAAQVR